MLHQIQVSESEDVAQTCLTIIYRYDIDTDAILDSLFVYITSLFASKRIFKDKHMDLAILICIYIYILTYAFKIPGYHSHLLLGVSVHARISRQEAELDYLMQHQVTQAGARSKVGG